MAEISQSEGMGTEIGPAMTGTVVMPSDRQLPPLTAKQTKFLAALLSGKTAIDALKESHRQESERWTASTCYTKATLLRNHHKIRVWWAACVEAELVRSDVDKGTHLAALARLRERAVVVGQLGPAVKAEISRGMVSGLYEHDPRKLPGQRVPDHNLVDLIAINDPDLAAGLRAILPAPQASEGLSEVDDEGKG